MAEQAISICATAIAFVIQWFDQIITAMDAGGLIFTAFCVVGVISMLFMPFRGSFGSGMGDDYSKHQIHKPRSRKRSDVIYSRGPNISGSLNSPSD